MDGIDLAQLRRRLDDVDERLVDLIARRLEIVASVGAAKAEAEAPVRDPERERAVLAAVESAAVARGVSSALVRRIFSEIVSHSVDQQVAELLPTIDGPVAVAYPGSEYTDHHLAARKYADVRAGTASYLPVPTYADAFLAVESGRAHMAVVPIESTSAGSFNQVYDLLQRRALAIVGEETWYVDHVLAAPQVGPLGALTRIVSTSGVFESCSELLSGLPTVELVPARDTSIAMETVRQRGEPTWAAIGPAEAADAFELVTLRRRITDVESVTRYVVVARGPLPIDERIPCKTSIVLVTRHEDGALLRCLEILSAHGRSMTKLESRPMPGRPFEYLFFVDFAGNVADAATQQMIKALRDVTLSVKVLGSYAAKTLGRTESGRTAGTAADEFEAVLPAPD